MKAVRLTRNLVVVIALVVSLGANVTLFVGGVLYSFVDEFVDGAFGLVTDAATQRRALAALKTSSAKQARALAASKAVAARQRGELSTLKAAAATQRREIAALKALSAKQRRVIAASKAAAVKRGRDFHALKTASVRQGRELAASRAANGKLGKQIAKIRHTTSSVAKRSRDRLVKSVGRSVLTAPGKALPYAGVSIVAVLTVWEINDLCATIGDMDEIQRAAGESEAKSVDCSRPDLAIKRVIEKIGDSSRKAWDENKRYVPDLPTLDELRRLWPDAWWGTWDSLKRLLP